MAAECNVSVIAEVTGLGENLSFLEKFSVTGTVLKAVLNRQIQTTTNTAEALNLCGISTVELVIIKATSNDLILDTDCADNASFVQDQSVAEGECRILKPDGTDGIFIKNEDGTEVCTVDVLIVGSA